MFEPITLSEETLAHQRDKSHKLFKTLQDLVSSDNGKTNIKRIENTVYGTDVKLYSWRFNEWDYYSKKVKLPSNARGLFTDINGDIVCRGYDKFFNINELQSVKEETLRSDTVGPYTVTVKSNGCIVFVSGLSDGTLVVCSKHSTGIRDDLSKNHALTAQKALKRQLEQNSLSSKDLALILFKYKITAVCEYCDDDFEEHVLEYKNDKAGLYLHGLNLNTVEFKTYPMDQVNQFAQQFAFKETKYIVCDTFNETLALMEKCNETGTFQDEEIEGFVIRCRKPIPDTDKLADFFFKFKFQEPYLLYRELREVTKQFINTGPESIKFGKHKLICMDYIKFVMPYLVTDEKLKSDYLDNKGIIELRKKYFESKNESTMKLISDELKMLDLEDEMKKLKFGETKSKRYVLVTVATIGCGKTTTSVGLMNLFPELIGHVQNDNIQTPGKDKLVVAALDVLKEKPIVIIDKNNHKFAERKQIFDSFEKLNDTIPKSKLKFICLNFIQSSSPKKDTTLWELTRNRVVERGDDHQSIKVETDGIVNAEKIMRGFISRFQKVEPSKEPDSKFDYIIDLDVSEKDSSLKNMELLASKLQKIVKDVELPTPSRKKFQKAFENAKNYKPVFTKKMKINKLKPNYFGIHVPSENVLSIIESNNIDFFTTLKEKKRVQKDFHITLVHSAMRREGDEKRSMWKTYNDEFKNQVEQFSKMTENLPPNNRHFIGEKYNATIKATKIFWNNKVMCIEADVMRFNKGEVQIELPVGNRYTHITIGTIDKSIPPMMAGVMLNNYYDGKVNDIHVKELETPIILEQLPLYAFMN